MRWSDMTPAMQRIVRALIEADAAHKGRKSPFAEPDPLPSETDALIAKVARRRKAA